LKRPFGSHDQKRHIPNIEKRQPGQVLILESFLIQCEESKMIGVKFRIAKKYF